MSNYLKPKPGDIVTTSGQGLVSDVINLGTAGIPRWHASHVGVVARLSISSTRSRLLVVESTSLLAKSDVCEILGTPTSGVRASTLQEFADRPGKAWIHPLSRTLFDHETIRLSGTSRRLMGKDYDYFEAGLSAGVIVSSVLSVLRGESLSKFFCSELVAHLFSEIGLFPTRNASRWSPNKLVRRMACMGLLKPRQRLEPIISL